MEGHSSGRDYLFGYYGAPGSNQFKIMVRDKTWKYIYMANGGRELLFNLKDDSNELNQLAGKYPNMTKQFKEAALLEIQKRPSLKNALDNQRRLKVLSFKERPLTRIHQFDSSKNIDDFIY